MFNYRVARTLDGAGVTEAAQDAARQRRLAGAELAFERHQHAAVQRGRERATGAQRGVGIRKQRLARRHHRARAIA